MQSRRALALFIAGALLFWSQDNNLSWGFQSQFFLAQLLPMCAQLWLGRAIQYGDNSRDFAIACFFGVLPTGTMANGILALPLMFLYALLLRINLRRTALLALLTALCLTAYFATYVSPPAHGHLSEALRNQPLHWLAYTMAYLGSPFYYMVGKGIFGGAVAALAGNALALGWQGFSASRSECEASPHFDGVADLYSLHRRYRDRYRRWAVDLRTAIRGCVTLHNACADAWSASTRYKKGRK